jgi:hypothetical protein
VYHSREGERREEEEQQNKMNAKGVESGKRRYQIGNWLGLLSRNWLGLLSRADIT